MSKTERLSRKERRKRSRSRDPLAAEDLAEQIDRRRHRRWPWITLGVFLIVLFLLPNLASFSSVRSYLVKSVSKDLPVAVHVDGASVGWFSPITLYGVHVADLDGEPLLDADQITCRSSLSSLLFNNLAPGVVRVENAVAKLRVDGKSTNWEQVIAQLPPPASDKPLDLDAAVEVVGGTIIVEDIVTGITRQITEINGRVDYPRIGVAPLGIALSANVAGDGTNPGTLELECEWMLPIAQETESTDYGSGSMTLDAKQLPLEIASPFIHRAGLAESATGFLNGTIVASRTAEGGPLRVAINSLTASQLQVIKPTGLAEPQISLNATALAGEFTFDPSRLTWKAVTLASDMGEVSTNGGVNLAELGAGRIDSALAGMPQKVVGRVDVAALARMLPSTISVRDDVTLRGGAASFDFGSQAAAGASVNPGNQSWSGSLQIADIEVITAAGQVHRVPPARVALSATSTPSGIVIDQLDGQGEFFAIRGQGSTSRGQITASVSLDHLQRELQHAIDMRGAQLAGNAELLANWSLGEQGEWNASASSSMTNWQLSLPGRGVWQEPHLTISARTTGVMANGSLQQLQQGEVIVRAGPDEFNASLASAIDLTTESAALPINFTMIGNANRWQTRLAALLPMQDTWIDGNISARGQVIAGANLISWKDVQLHAEPLLISTPSMQIEEPLTDIDTSGTYSLADSRLNVKLFQLAGTSLSVQAVEVAADLAAAKPTATGQLAFRGDWSRISRWFAQPADAQATPWRMEGTFDGKASLVAQNDLISGTLAITNKDTAFYQYKSAAAGVQTASTGPQWQLQWSEPEATVNGKLAYQTATGSLQLENLSLLSKMVHFVMAGTVSGIGSKPVANLGGSMEYDLERVSAMMATSLGNDVQLRGKKRSEFTIRGPLTSDLRLVSSATSANQTAPEPLVSLELTGTSGVAWDGAMLYGLQVGPSGINARLEQSVLTFDPISVPISDGQLNVNSRLFLYEPSPTLVIAKGRVVDNVRITPQMCRDWLKYVAPLTADVTRVEGRLSLDLNDSQIPLGEPRRANTSGTLMVSNAQLGPGPLSEALIFLARRIRSLAAGRPVEGLTTQNDVWLNIPQQQIPFAAREGRVYHENMRTTVGDVQIVTSGSVGFDQSLQMVAEIPIRAEWFPNRQGVLASLAGRKLQIPVGGTVTKPEVDSRVLEDLAKQGIQGAANDLINEGINRGLNRLFGPPPQ